MTDLLHELIGKAADARGSAIALKRNAVERSYEAFWGDVQAVARGLLAEGLERLDRVAVYLPKTLENVATIFGTSLAGGVFVPVNPLLKAPQVRHILGDCNVRVLVSSAARFRELKDSLKECSDLRVIVVVDETAESFVAGTAIRQLDWRALMAATGTARYHRNIDTDMAAILYTSGSTGRPKGVVLSHRNMVTGCESVAAYLGNTPHDRLLAALPLSFDYGFSQLSTAFRVGATVVLMDYLLPKDVLTAVARERVTGLAGVPPLWSQLAELDWPAEAKESLRYFTNSGGAMPSTTLKKLRHSLPKARPFLMYGLTEAFRSTYLPPEEVDRRPDSIGKAIPNAEILVVRPDGTACSTDEPGELIHRGSLVALGYWNDPAKTAERFRPVPGQDDALVLTEVAVWSGDTVRRDSDGFLYFIGRRDEMIKTSGYRVSPTEVEEVLLATGLVNEAVAVGVPHAVLGQSIVVVATPAAGRSRDTGIVLNECRARLPNFMVPARIEWRESLPRNPNGKYDRTKLAAELAEPTPGER
jgi:acyl-CoA ligase (AMP-forming) (exosortase A-associated)